MESGLIDEEVHVIPRVYIKDNVKGSDREKIKSIVKKKGGDITDDEEDATHIIHPHVRFFFDFEIFFSIIYPIVTVDCLNDNPCSL